MDFQLDEALVQSLRDFAGELGSFSPGERCCLCSSLMIVLPDPVRSDWGWK